MKLFLFLVVLLSLFSCKKSRNDDNIISNRAPIEAITEPIFFHDSLGSGELFTEDKISQIKRYSYGWDNYFYIDYYPDTKKLKSIFYKPAAHPQSCAFGRCDFFFKKDRVYKIEISSPSSGCAINIRTFQFDYFPKGALKSVTQENELMINETFFAYDNLGKISKIFKSGRYKNESTYRFSETTIKYDLKGNVNEVLFRPHYADSITQRLSYSYDTTLNPFKGIYFPENFLSVFGWDESYAVLLSPNIVNLTARYIVSNSATQSYPYTIGTNNSRLEKFSYFDQFNSTFYYQ